MSKHTNISPHEAADRLAIRELVDANAHCADRRDAKGQMSLFTKTLTRISADGFLGQIRKRFVWRLVVKDVQNHPTLWLLGVALGRRADLL